MSRIKELIRQNLSPFIQGPEIDAIIEAMSEEALREEKLAIAAFGTLFLSTASDIYLKRRASEVGIIPPESIGIDDFVLRNLAIDITAKKQVTSVIHDVIETFYSPVATRAFAQSGASEPYNLLNPSDPNRDTFLEFEIDKKKIIYQVQATEYPTGSLTSVTAQQLASALTKSIRQQGSEGFAEEFVDPNDNRKYVRIFSGSKGPTGMVRILGGDLVRILEMPRVTEIVDLEAPGPTLTTWTLTKSGSTVRFTFTSGDQPSFQLVDSGLYCSINDTDLYSIGLFGYFPVTGVKQGAAGVGYFEIDAPNSNILTATPYQQALTTDVVFYKQITQKPYFNRRYGLAWETGNQKLKIYLPAVTLAVSRGLEGSAHVHLGKSTAPFNNTIWGSPTFSALQISVLSPYSFSFTPVDYEADVLVPSGRLTVQWSATTPYLKGTVVQSGGLYYRALVDSLGQTPPSATYWEQVAQGGLIEYIRRDDGKVVVVMDPSNPHGLGLFESTITARELSGNTRQLTTSAPHGIKVGDTFIVASVGALYDTANAVAKTGTSGSTLVYDLVTPGSEASIASSGSVRLVSGTYRLTKDTAQITDVITVEDDPVNTFVGAYVYEPTERYMLGSYTADLTQDVIAGNSYSFVNVSSTVGIPNKPGSVVFSFGSNSEEYPVPIIGTLTNKLLLDPSYKFKYTHLMKQNQWLSTTTYNIGNKVFYDGNTYESIVSGNLNNLPINTAYWKKIGLSSTVTYSSSNTVSIDPLGSDYAFYLTGIAEARNYCQKILEQITALGINLEIIILYPSDVGLGNEGTSTRDKTEEDRNIELEPRTDSQYENNDVVYSYDE
jgi:hypothetical protein